MNYPECFTPLPATPTVCYWWIFLHDPSDVPGKEEFNQDSRCGKWRDWPCASNGENPDAPRRKYEPTDEGEI